jgi:hypothetical protein
MFHVEQIRKFKMTNVNVDSAVSSEVKVQADEGFVKAYAAIEKVGDQLGGKWAKLARYAIEQSLSRSVILESFKSMGKKYETAQSLTSRTLDLMKPENSWKLDKMEAGELSVRDARLTTISLAADGKTIVRAAVAPRPANVRIADFLQSAANVAVVQKLSLSEFLERATNAFTVASEPKVLKPSKESSEVAGN